MSRQQSPFPTSPRFPASGSNGLSQISRDNLTFEPRGNSEIPNGSRETIELQESPDPPPNAVLKSVLSAFQKEGATRNQRMVNPDRERDRAAEQEQKRRMREREIRRANSRPQDGGSTDAILNEISAEWAEVIDEDFNPVTLALSLLDKSSVGRGMVPFRRSKQVLENALKGSVDKYYQSFAAALPHHATLLTSLGKTQTEIKDVRTKLQETREAFGNKRADLAQLWARGQMVEEMMGLLDEIDYLKSVPDALESLMSEKRLLQASILLVKSLKSINKPDMQDIGAVSDLRSYLAGQEIALREILVEELHAHLYLKTYWSDSRWAPYTPNQQTLPAVDFDKDEGPAVSRLNKQPAPLLASTPISSSPKLKRFLKDLAIRPNESPYDLSSDADFSRSTSSHLRHTSTSSLTSLSSLTQKTESTRNPESDSFAYMGMLLESLAVLGKLGPGLDAVSQRLPVEIHGLVDATIDEVGERAEFGKRLSVLTSRALVSKDRPSSVYVFANDGPVSVGALGASSLRLTALESATKHADHETLRDLFWTLYSKLDAVLQGLRVMSEVTNKISVPATYTQRREFKDSSDTKPGTFFPLQEIWGPIEAEVLSLLREYITDDDQGSTAGRNPISSINEVLRGGKALRDKSKSLFRFGDTDGKNTGKVLKRHEDELARVLKETVPGLVGSSADGVAQTTLLSIGTEDRIAAAGQHRLLIRPDAFHVGLLFQPTLSFLARVTEILPGDIAKSAETSSAFLDQFVLKVYLPQLEDKVTVLFLDAASSLDSFQEDPESKRLSPQPLIKASTRLMALINSLCTMLQSTPFHRESYSRLILGVVIQFYQRCSDRFRDLVSRDDRGGARDSRVSISARWAQKPELAACLIELLTCSTPRAMAMCRQENRVELNLLGTQSINKDELIPSTRNISALGNLYNSLSWFIAQLKDLKTVAEDPVLPEEAEIPDTPVSAALSPISAQRRGSVPRPTLADNMLRLPLTRAMAMRFDALLKTYEQLAELVLCTLRIDLRCRTIHYIDLAVQQGNYYIDNEAFEPDPHIMDLNAELAECDDRISSTISEREQRFVFEGLGALMDHLLIHTSRRIRRVNKFGVNKIMRNVLALQQNIKAISISDSPEDTEFERARRFWDLFNLTPTQMLDSIRQQSEFSFEEYKSMLNFQCGVDQTTNDSGPSSSSDFSLFLIELHALAMDDWGDDDT
ncbi:hypothetical protein BOTBODRAFT_142567 [Botryobasidium botryosum FD-172 SS1]|uniref:Exocyst complex component Sec8 n=1 Tax=Botryobasidium botryosum (strain FD-172 SS1) TaxID=930990 RepID=A0A067N815_BOTB1|nr:hypothetical protein BOTBODRAFT_142567 [Botryobasidium botryosum FD-172 SS1]